MKKPAVAVVLSVVLGLASVVIILLRIGTPHHGAIALGTYLLGWGALLYGGIRFLHARRTGRDAVQAVAAKKRLLVTALLLLAFGYAVIVAFPIDEARLATMDDAAVAVLIARDSRLLDEAAAGCGRAVAALQATGVWDGNPADLNPEQRADLLARWGAVLDHCFALETLKQRHRSFWQINYLQQPDLNAQSFLIAYSAFTTVCRTSAELALMTEDSRELATLLNEERRERGIPGNALFALQQGLTTPETLLLLNAGYANLAFLKERGHFAEARLQQRHARTLAAADAVFAALGKNPERIVTNPLAFYEQTSFTLWFPFQKNLAEWMGDVRTTGRPPLIALSDLQAVRDKLEPGDIMIERRNWYLSNLGLPGFWPHAALYTGDLTQLDAYFAEQRDLTGGKTFSEYIAVEFPAVRAAFDHQVEGYRPSVIEAVSEGVILHPFEVSAHADYVAMLRPRLDKKAKLQAILESFRHFGKPYDFNFDFITDNEVVCSELVCKAYEPRAGKAGIRFVLEESAGRQVVPPNSIIARFDRESGTTEAALDFVAFLDGSETDRRAYRRDAETLRASWRRPKWDVAQE